MVEPVTHILRDIGRDGLGRELAGVAAHTNPGEQHTHKDLVRNLAISRSKVDDQTNKGENEQIEVVRENLADPDKAVERRRVRSEVEIETRAGANVAFELQSLQENRDGRRRARHDHQKVHVIHLPW